MVSYTYVFGTFNMMLQYHINIMVKKYFLHGQKRSGRYHSHPGLILFHPGFKDSMAEPE